MDGCISPCIHEEVIRGKWWWNEASQGSIKMLSTILASQTGLFATFLRSRPHHKINPLTLLSRQTAHRRQPINHLGGEGEVWQRRVSELRTVAIWSMMMGFYRRVCNIQQWNAPTVFMRGKSRTLPINGTFRKNWRTVGKNSQNKSQNPYASKRRPTIVQLYKTNAHPPR